MARNTPPSTSRVFPVTGWNTSLSLELAGLVAFAATGPQTGALQGLARFSAAEAAERFKVPPVKIKRLLADAERLGVLRYDPDARVVFLPWLLAEQCPRNPNTMKAWGRAARDVPPCALREDAVSMAEQIIASSGHPEWIAEFRGETGVRAGERFPQRLPEPLQDSEQSRPDPNQASPTQLDGGGGGSGDQERVSEILRGSEALTEANVDVETLARELQQLAGIDQAAVIARAVEALELRCASTAGTIPARSRASWMRSTVERMRKAA